MVDTMRKDLEISGDGARRTHRTYTGEFKAELVAACQKAGTSIAALANAHGMNANVLHRWLKEHSRNGAHQLSTSGNVAAPYQRQVQAGLPAFVALTLPAASSEPVPAPAAPPLTIRIEVQRANTTIVVNWPLQGAASCAQWLRECLP
jgi:transposase-like protein